MQPYTFHTQQAALSQCTSSEEINFPSVGPADVAIFWDFENVRIPAWCPTSTAVEEIRNKVAKYGRIVEKRLYYDSRQPTENTAPRTELDLSGFTLVDCPSRNRKETLDKKLIVDVLCFAWERASRGAQACVVLITSDGDYSYALARLRDLGVFTVVIYRPEIVAKVLIDNANVVLSWEFDVLSGSLTGTEEDEAMDDHRQSDDQKLRSLLKLPPSASEVISLESSKSGEREEYKDNGRLNCPAEVRQESTAAPFVESPDESHSLVRFFGSTSCDRTREVQSEQEFSTIINQSPPDLDGSSGPQKYDIQQKHPLGPKTRPDYENTSHPKPPLVSQPDQETRSIFATFCSVVLDAQHRNVKAGITVTSSWACEGAIGAAFYEKSGRKDRDGYLRIRALASEKHFIEWGRRNLNAPGNPVLKVKDRCSKPEGSSTETYLRLTYSGLSILNVDVQNLASHQSYSSSNNCQKVTEKAKLINSGQQELDLKNAKLFVGGVAWESTEDSLRSYFLRFGPIKRVFLMYGSGWGFVQFSDPNDAECALKPPCQHSIDGKAVE